MPAARGSSPRLKAGTPTSILTSNHMGGGKSTNFPPYILPTLNSRNISPAHFYPSVRTQNHGWHPQVPLNNNFVPKQTSLNPKSQNFYPTSLLPTNPEPKFSTTTQTPVNQNKSPRITFSETFTNSKGQVIEIRNVCKENLEAEMFRISKIASVYKYIAMDTEFPGTVAKPSVNVPHLNYNYQTVRVNADLLKLIQLGVSFADEEGNLAKADNTDVHCCCWQFHFKFSLREDMYAQESIELLKRSGLDFELHESHGIEVQDFGELLVTSGMVLLRNVHWISFHGSYDFAYLLKILMTVSLPETENDFKDRLCAYFKNFYDIKMMMGVAGHLCVGGVFMGGLKDVAEFVSAERIGPEHQAGSDSLLTLETYFKLKKKCFSGEKGSRILEKCANILFMA